MRLRAPPRLLVVALFAAASGQGLGEEPLFPWVERPLPPAAVVREALARGCPGNTSGAGFGDIYAEFADVVQDRNSLYNLRLGEAMLSALTGRGLQWNRHLLACPFAVWKAIQLWCLIHMRQAAAGLSEPEAWAANWHEVRHAMRVWQKLDFLVDCANCGVGWYERVDRALEPFGGRAGSHWIWGDVQKYTKDMKTEMRASTQHRWTGNFSDAQHAALLRDSKALLDEMQSRGLLQHWVVSHGTMVTALRYGSNRAVRLPSGHAERDQARTFDMDVYVMTDGWDDLCATITKYAKKHLGFNWCGWIDGWPKRSMQCWRGEGELEIHNIDKREAEQGVQLPPHPIGLSMAPPSRCLGGPGLELPCPRDPLVFMQYLWRKRPHYIACLALPMSRDRQAEAITKQDVRFLWEQSLTLYEQGFMNMAPYFGSCTEHPLAEYAQSLYWSIWELT